MASSVYSKSEPVASKIDEDMIFIFRSTPFLWVRDLLTSFLLLSCMAVNGQSHQLERK